MINGSPTQTQSSGYLLAHNPDSQEPRFQSKLGIYQEGCGLDKVALSWGHEEYIYHVCKDHLPEEGFYMLRYHSLYPGHREGEYDQLCDARDRAMLKWVNAFNPYDLHAKSHTMPDEKELPPFYEAPIKEFFPAKLIGNLKVFRRCSNQSRN